MNLYAYVGNNPVSVTDVDGHDFIGVDGSGGGNDGIGGQGDPAPPDAQAKTAVEERQAQNQQTAQQPGNGQGQQNQTGLAGNHTIDKDAIANYIDEHAQPKSLRGCAAYCRRAFEAGGIDTKGHPVDAKGWGPTLLKNGAVVVPQDGYAPQKTDVAVFAGNDAHPIGHITVYDGKQWVSDFKQKNMSPYRTGSPPVTIYRFPDN